MSTLPQTILQHAQALPEGGVISPKQFLHLGSRAAIDQALSRLTRQGRLLRAGCGTYVTPVSSRFGTRPPAPERVVASLSARSGETVAAHGHIPASGAWGQDIAPMGREQAAPAPYNIPQPTAPL